LSTSSWPLSAGLLLGVLSDSSLVAKIKRDQRLLAGAVMIMPENQVMTFGYA